MTDSDPHGLFFGSTDEDGSGLGEHDGFADSHQAHTHQGGLPVVERVSRSERRAEQGHHAARRRNRRLLGVMSALLVVVVAVAAWLVVLPIYHYLHPSDYNGKGTG